MNHAGSCLCGRVTFVVSGPLPAPSACHCTMCRKQTGHFEASSDVLKSDVAITGADNLVWYQSSAHMRRGFCGTCGSHLFAEDATDARMSVLMGGFDGPTGVSLTHHIFVADKGDYYDLTDGLPQHAELP